MAFNSLFIIATCVCILKQRILPSGFFVTHLYYSISGGEIQVFNVFKRKKFDANMSIAVDILTQQMDELKAETAKKLDEILASIKNDNDRENITIKIKK